MLMAAVWTGIYAVSCSGEDTDYVHCLGLQKIICCGVWLADDHWQMHTTAIQNVPLYHLVGGHSV